MVYGYDGRHPDKVHDDIVAVCVLLKWQGLDNDVIERGVLKRYGEEVSMDEIEKSIPHYLGERKGYKPNKKVLLVKTMLSGQIP